MGRTVRRVTGLTALGLDSRVFEYKWTLLVAVAVETDGVLSRRVTKLSARARMCVMTICAVHQAFVDAVTKRLIEIRFDLLVARVAQVPGLVHQEILGVLWPMNVVTGSAADASPGVNGTIEGGVFLVGFVTRHATFRRLFLRLAFKSKYLAFISTAFDVCRTWTVAGFASMPGVTATLVESCFVVRTHFNLFELLLVTSLAGVRANVLVLGRSSRFYLG